jgi:hypothetical protein
MNCSAGWAAMRGSKSSQKRAAFALAKECGLVLVEQNEQQCVMASGQLD